MQDETLIVGITGDYAVTVEAGPGERDFALTDPAVDLDGNGILDTRLFTDEDGMTIASDLDGDGFADHLTRIEEDGAYAAWEPRRDGDGVVRWERTDLGRL